MHEKKKGLYVFLPTFSLFFIFVAFVNSFKHLMLIARCA